MTRRILFVMQASPGRIRLYPSDARLSITLLLFVYFDSAICHLAAVLPICYLAYACNGDLTGSTGKQRKLMRMASREAYAMLKAQGIPILPEGDDQYYAPGVKGAIMQFLYFGMARWKTAGDAFAYWHPVFFANKCSSK